MWLCHKCQTRQGGHSFEPETSPSFHLRQNSFSTACSPASKGQLTPCSGPPQLTLWEAGSPLPPPFAPGFLQGAPPGQGWKCCLGPNSKSQVCVFKGPAP